MEVFLYNSTVCRLCGEENDNGSFLYFAEENNQSISELVNAYLPIKVSDDGQLPRTICPGCTIQLEATVEFINLIVNGQKVIRALYQRELEYKKTVLNEEKSVAENVVNEINIEEGAYKPDHSISLQVAGRDKPKRKRGRPPKQHKTPEELAQEAAAKEEELLNKKEQKNDDLSGKRKRKAPTRFKEVVQGKELEKIFKDEGMTDGEDSDSENKANAATNAEPVQKVPEIIGHTDTGEVVVIVKGKGRGRPKGRLNQKRQTCAICNKEFFCSGRYMSHVAQHGPVLYQCQGCNDTFPTRLDFTKHQEETGHQGQTVIPCDKKQNEVIPLKDPLKIEPDLNRDDNVNVVSGSTGSLPDLGIVPVNITDSEDVVHLKMPEGDTENEIIEIEADSENAKEDKSKDETDETGSREKMKLTCPYCDKKLSSRQSKSMHIKAVHKGERPYACGTCGATFAYPRARALHALRHRNKPPKGFACDLCGKVLNHPSSVTYHKEAEHAGHQYVCSKCHKPFKHRQLLQRHQLVHSHQRPFHCKTCNASFKTKANLLNHSLLHTGVKKHACEICKQKFSHKTSLTLHMRWHSGQKPYACKVCGKAFSQKGNLSEHSRIHTGEKPFQCLHCPRRFTTSSQHRLHLRRHANKDKLVVTICEGAEGPEVRVGRSGGGAGGAGGGDEANGGGGGGGGGEAGEGGSFKCGWCGRACLSRWALAKHTRRHTGERPFKCPHCPRAFADCSNLNKHKKHVHKRVSLLANQDAEMASLALVEGAGAVRGARDGAREGVREGVAGVVRARTDSDQRVIYVTYDVAAHSPAYQLVDAEQTEEFLEQAEVVSTHSLEDTESVLVSAKEESVVQEHLSVTDEQGNPLHFTMQDGTQLAITSLDGQSLQVITQDGQTIPVEINGFTSEESLSEANTIVHELNVQKNDEQSVDTPVTHYFYETYKF